MREKESPTGTRHGAHWLPAECDVSIRPGWFWHERENARVKTPEQLIELRSLLASRDVHLSNEVEDDKTLEELRALYEPYTKVLSQYLLMQLPDWLPKARVSDNWQTSAWEVRAPAPDQTFQKCMRKGHRSPSSVHPALHKPQ